MPEDLLAERGAALELAVLTDGGIMLASNKPLVEVVRFGEFNELDRSLTLYGVKGGVSHIEMPIPANMLRDVTASNNILIYTLFPGEEPLGYLVELLKRK